MGKATEAGERLFAAFRRAVPLPTEFGGRKRPREQEVRQRVDAGLTYFYEVARGERHRLSVIGRARVAFDLQKRLLAAGYAPALVKQVVFAMLVAAFVGR